MKRPDPRLLPTLASLGVLLLLFGLGCLRFPDLLSPRVILNLFGDNSCLGVAAIGATFVILSGGIDLSVGAVVAFTGILVASLLGHGVPPLAAFALALLVGTLFGTLMGWLIQTFELPAFLVTLGGMFLARGLAFIIHPQSIAIEHAFYADTLPGFSLHIGSTTNAAGRAIPLLLPFTAVCLGAATLIGTLLARSTAFGRDIYAIGSSESSARLMGVPVARTKILVYGLAGFMSAFAGLVDTFYKQSGNPASFVGLELEAIAAAVIGGTLLRGGVGYIPGTLVGVLILGLIQTLVTFQGNLSSWWTKIAIGGLLFVFILLQQVLSKRKA